MLYYKKCLYRSVYMYDETVLPDNSDNRRSLAGYYGQRYIDNI